MTGFRAMLTVLAALLMLSLNGAAGQMIEADYVIVGGGTAGCVLAARLCTGLPNASVVVMERAPPRSPEAEAAVRPMRNFFNPVVGDTPEVTEAWQSAPNSGLAGSKTVTVFTGHTLGGSSAINGAQFSTPVPSVVAAWNVSGLTAAKTSERFTALRSKLQVAQPPPGLTTDYHPEYFAANEAVGVKVIAPPELPTGADEDSVWTSYLLADKAGNRLDSYRVYLEPVRAACANLQVVEGATATKVILGANGTATGVQYKTSRNGATQEVSASKEVILAAGPYHTPKLLQLSGIGPKPLLDTFNISQQANLPVGQFAQSRAYDNILSAYTGAPLSKGGSNDSDAARVEATDAFNAGEPSWLGFTTAQINGIWAAPVGIWRVISWIFDIGPGTDPRVHQSGCIPNPESYASVQISSADAFDTPRVDTNIYGAPGEVESMIQCLENEREVIQQLPASFNMTELPRFSANITAAEVKDTTVNGNHFVGSAGIGRVLDGDLKVKGFSNLRVVDASAIPTMPPNSGPSACVYLLAEHISEAIVVDAGGSIPARNAEEEPALIPQKPIITLARGDAAAATTPAPLQPGCGRIGLAVGSYTNISWLDPPPAGQGVSILSLTVCNGTNGTLSGTLDQNYVIPPSQAGENPEYCDNYDESLIICVSSRSEGDAAATVLDLSAGPSSDGSNAETVELPGVVQPVHIAVLSSGVVATANYAGSSFGTFDPGLEGDAVVQTITVPEGNATMDSGDPERQEAPHPHQILEAQDGSILVCDLGTDSVYRYRVSPEGALTGAGLTKVPAGSGPRHAALGPNGKVYVALELTLQIIELGPNCTEGSQGGAAGICETTDLPKSNNATGSTYTSAAAIRVSEDNKFVYVSMRTEEDTAEPGAIVGYQLSAGGAVGERVGTWPTGGPKPRDFVLAKVPGIQDEVIVVGNRKDDAVDVFARDTATGVMGAKIASLEVDSPTSILPLQGEVSAVAGTSTNATASPAPAPPPPPPPPAANAPGGAPRPPAAPAANASAPAPATATPPAARACGGAGQPVCRGAQLNSRDPKYECDFGYVGEDGVCVPWRATSGPAATPPSGGSNASAPAAGCGGGGQPTCSGAQLEGRDPKYECDFGYMGEGGVCVPWRATSAPASTPPIGGSNASARAAGCGGGGQPTCSGARLEGRDPKYECDFGYVGRGGVCVPWTSPDGAFTEEDDENGEASS